MATSILKPEHIDISTFEQILELDESDSRDIDSFSGSIVFNFFEQAEQTFGEIEEKLKSGDLAELFRLGHFLKGSSATLGLHRIRDACEKIQNLGAGKDESGVKDLKDSTYALNAIRSTLQKMKHDYADANSILKKFYNIK